CQGAAFEYLFNVEYELRKNKVRDMAEIVYISNESVLGDFGVGGLQLKRGGYVTHSKLFAESLFAERGIDWVTSAHVYNVEKNRLEYELMDGSKHEMEFDFAMLIPPFSGVGLRAYDQKNTDITDQLFAANGFMFVDGDYTQKPFTEWKGSDWPRTYQNQKWNNIFAAGIAFAPPHLISKPMKSANGTPINPTPPRTGMPSAMIGKAVAMSICDMITGKTNEPTYTASMSQIGAACVASAGNNLISGSAVAMTMFPIVHDFEKYPDYGRDIRYSYGEIGLAAHWIKILLHHGFLYKAKANPFWYIIPE
ncbi:MAG: NAD(P)/FAD-dependent oxidoreductase, partial [Calditrichaeota bacterium]